MAAQEEEVITAAAKRAKELLDVDSRGDGGSPTTPGDSVALLKDFFTKMHHREEAERQDQEYNKYLDLLRDLAVRHLPELVETSEAEGPATERDRDTVERTLGIAGKLLERSLASERLAKAQESIPKDSKQMVQNYIEYLPVLIEDYMSNFKSMLKTDKSSLGKSTVGIAIAAAGIGILAMAATASNPVGLALLGGLAICIGVSMAKRALAKHKLNVKEKAKAEAKEDVPEEELEALRAEVTASSPKLIAQQFATATVKDKHVRAAIEDKVRPVAQAIKRKIGRPGGSGGGAE